MSRLRRGKAGLRAALLIGAVAAAFGIGGVSPGSALAANCTGEAILGEGSSLQKAAQATWTKGWNGATGLCVSGPAITYEPNGSGAGLKAWGANGAGETFTLTRQFIGTDDAPTGGAGGQIENIKNAVKAETASKGAEKTTKVLVVPVTQTAIAIVALPPTGCTLGSDNLTNRELLGILNGSITQWSQLNFAEGGASCEKPIVRVVRNDASGTSYQLKHYLQVLNVGVNGAGAKAPCTKGKTWAELQPSNGAAEAPTNPNLTWPEESGCEGKEKEGLGKEFKAVKRGQGGGGLVKTVIEANMATEGRIGYAALADAETTEVGGAKALILNLENNGLHNTMAEVLTSAEFASPLDPNLAGSANCKEAEYTGVPAGNEDADWSGVYGANDAIEKETYPLCTLTWDLALTNSSGVFGPGKRLTLREYLLHVVDATAGAGHGQEETAHEFYSPLPENIQKKAKEAAELIN